MDASAVLLAQYWRLFETAQRNRGGPALRAIRCRNSGRLFHRAAQSMPASSRPASRTFRMNSWLFRESPRAWTRFAATTPGRSCPRASSPSICPSTPGAATCHRPIREHGITLMLEIGCFLCGSTRQWLDASPDLVRHRGGPLGRELVGLRAQGAPRGNPMLADPRGPVRDRGHDPAVRQLRARPQQHPRRARPLHPRAPALARRPCTTSGSAAILPELIYIDALKSDEDLWVAHEVFPASILCGDDWTWRDETGATACGSTSSASRPRRTSRSRRWGTWLLPPGPRRPTPAPLPWDADAARALVEEVDPTARALLRDVLRCVHRREVSHLRRGRRRTGL